MNPKQLKSSKFGRNLFQILNVLSCTEVKYEASSQETVNPERYGGQGDLLRITANGKTKDGKHKLNNGAVYSCDGFTPSGDIVLSSGWVMAKDFGTFDHAYVSTAQASQGRTVSIIDNWEGALQDLKRKASHG